MTGAVMTRRLTCACADVATFAFASGAIIAVDGDILLGEVAGQHAVATASEAEADLEGDHRLLHDGGDLVLVIRRVAQALVCDPDAVEPDRQLVAVGRLARLADR